MVMPLVIAGSQRLLVFRRDDVKLGMWRVLSPSFFLTAPLLCRDDRWQIIDNMLAVCESGYVLLSKHELIYNAFSV